MRINFKSLAVYLIFLSFLSNFRFLNTYAKDKDDKIVIGLDVNVPPMGFKSESGEIIPKLAPMGWKFSTVSSLT